MKIVHITALCWLPDDGSWRTDPPKAILSAFGDMPEFVLIRQTKVKGGATKYRLTDKGLTAKADLLTRRVGA